MSSCLAVAIPARVSAAEQHQTPPAWETSSWRTGHGVSFSTEWLEAQPCGGLAAFHERLQGQLGQLSDVDHTAVELIFRAYFDWVSDVAIRITLVMTTNEGRAVRHLQAKSCEESLETLAFVVALLLDEHTGGATRQTPATALPAPRNRDTGDTPPEAARSEGEPPSNTAENAQPLDSASSDEAAGRAEPARSGASARPVLHPMRSRAEVGLETASTTDAEPARRASWAWEAGLGASVETGWAPDAILSPVVVGGLGWANSSLLSATFVGRLGRGQQSFVSSSVDVHVVGYSASLGACPLNLRLDPGPRLRACLAYGAGWLEVESDLERGRLQRTPWSSPEASLRLGFVSSWWTLEVWSGVRQHLTRPQYFATVDGSRIPLYRVPRWGFLAGISWAVKGS